jgi:hypothetical protein
VSNVIESFFVSLGFDINTEKIEEFKQKAGGLRESVLKIGAVATGAAAGIGLLVEGVARSMGELYSFAELNDVSARSVAALGKIATENDGSMEGMKNTIQSVNKTIGEAALGIGRGAMTFEKLGLAAKRADGSVKNVDDILGEVADKMEGMSRQEQIALASKLGIDPQFVKVLEKGSENLAKLREEAELMNPFSEKDYQLADEVDKLFIKAKGTLGVFTKMIGVSLLPTVREVLKNYLEWFKASRKATSGVFVTALQMISGAVGTLWDWVVRLVSGLKSAYDWLMQFKVVTYAAGVALAVFISVKTYDFVLQLGEAIRTLTLRMVTFNATALIIPAIIGAIILAIGLLIDDYVNWKEGSDSVIGGLIEQFPWLLGMIQTIENGVSQFIDFWLAQWGTLKGPLTDLGLSLWNLMSVVVESLWPAVKMIFTGWAYILAAVVPLVAMLIEWIAGFLVGAIRFVVVAFTWIIDTATTVFNGLLALVGFVVDGIVAYFTWWWGTVTSIYSAIVGLVGQVVDAVMGGVKSAVDSVMGIIDTAKQKVMGFIDSVVGAIGKVGQLLGLTNNAKDVKVTVQKQGEATVATGALPRDVPAKTASQQVDQSKPISAPVSPTPVAQALMQAPAMRSMNIQPAAASSNVGSSPVAQGVQSAPVVPAAQAGGVMGRAASNVNTTTSSQTTTNTTTISGTNITVNSPDPAKAGESVKNELDRLNKQAVRNGQSAVAL